MAVTLPRGFRMGAVRAGIKPSGKPDLALLASGLPALWAYAATQNRAAAPSVHRGRRLYAEGRPLRAVVVNAGNANCATGERGFRDDERLAELAAFRLGLSPEEVLTASTGVIGVSLPVEKVEKALPQLELGPFADPFAEAILTTDLAVKVAEREVEGARLVGVAKGSGMIHPNMATMLAFLVTDARVPQGVLRERWKGIVDRTFNLNIASAAAILRFFLDNWRQGLFLHFEMIPDRLPDPLRELIARFPPGALQLEVGIQTFNPQVAARISRRQDNARAEENLRFLRQHTGAHIHADLIAGLPGEDLQSFAAGFDRLVALDVQEIQLGILKRLRGAPIARHDQPWGMVYNPHPPYEILQTAAIDFATMQRLRRFARYWDLIVNSGNFPATSALLKTAPSPFFAFLDLADWLYARTGQAHGIARSRLGELLATYLASAAGRDPQQVAAAVRHDLQRRPPTAAHAKRQARHAVIRTNQGDP